MTRKSVKGLANIAQLLNQGGVLAAAPAPKRERRTHVGIFERTAEKMIASIDVGDPRGAGANLLRHYLQAGIREAYNLGHADALDQNGAVERLLEKQYQKRTEVTMPAVVAGVMEQLGLASMTLDLAHLATVFERNQITYTISDEDVIEYTMRPVGADA